MFPRSSMSTRMRPGLQCFQPRDYQVELLDKAVKKNTIVQLGTGSGKTFIAVLLLKEYGVQMFAPYENGAKRSFFVVEKVNLVEQQAKHIEIHTSFKVGQVHGQTSNDLWKSKAHCDQFMKEHHVIVITAQCLLDLINHAYVRIQDCCVLIFDECHHALGSKHPYRLIMKEYKDIKSRKEHVPRVLGLTASLIKEKVSPSKLEVQLNKLESVLDSMIETASDLVSLSKYGAKPYEAIVMCSDFVAEELKLDSYKNVYKVLKDTEEFVNTTDLFHKDLDVDPRRCLKDALKTIQAVLRQLGPWAAWKTAQFWEKELGKWSRTQIYPDKTILFFNLGKTAVITIKRLLEPEMRKIKSLKQLVPYIPHRVKRLFELFEMFHPDFQRERMNLKDEKREELSAIVFVEQRYIAYALHTLIRSVRQWEKDFKFVNSDFVIGASGQNLASSENQHKRQAEVLRRFQKNEINVLVATAVLEEGVDVKQCNVVVKFDRPLDMRSYVQSKGRARKKGSRYIVMTDQKDTETCNSDLKDFQQIERLLLERSRSVNNPVENDGDFFLDEENYDQLMAPLETKTGAKLTMTSAISMVNRYCSKLPSDIFTRLVPHNRIIPIEESGVTKYCAELLLPINSPIKHSIEFKNPMPSKKTAQMAVALEACRQLYEKGELDENLLPKSKDCPLTLEKIDEEPDEYAPGLSSKVGSAKRKQLYDKKIARALNESLVEPGKECYVYALELEKLRDSADPKLLKRRKTLNPTDHDYCFGFLSTKEIPRVPPFPVYLRQGDMEVRMAVAPQKVTLTEKELEQIHEFHDYLFTQVLQMCKTGNLQFDVSASTPLNTLVVPLDRSKDGEYSIKMQYVVDVVLNMQQMPRIPSDEVRRQFKFEPEKYKDAVVMPWYRNVEQPAFYYVAEIMWEHRPSSQFPDNHFTTFNEYFIKKYNLEIYDQEQSLLDVDFTSNRLNLLAPRVPPPCRRSRNVSTSSNPGVTSPSESKESVSASTSSTAIAPSQRQILVPELMDIHPISGPLWSVIAALPSIFYRLNQLLLTDELRETILVKAFGKDRAETKLTGNVEWSPLTYSSAYEEKQSLIVKKIQQLRELNRKAVEQQEEKNKKEVVEETEDGQFAIGVWDPEDAIRIGVDISSTREQLDADEIETAGLTTGLHDGNISDEDDDALPFTMHDYSARLTSSGRPGNVATEAWAPSDNIVPSGWGDLDGPGDGGVTFMDVDGSAAPFQILGDPVGGLNMQALMADVGRVFEGGAQAAPSAPLGATSMGQTTKKLTADELQRKKIQEEVLMKAREKLEDLEVLDQRDLPLRREEVVNLDEFDDPESNADEFQVEQPKTIDEEIGELSEAADRKKAVDDETVKVEVTEREVCQVLPIAVADAPARPFSFQKESPAMAGLLRERAEEAVSHLDSDVGMGVSPCLLLTALTCSNAGDGFSLERFETIGDSFLKYAVTDYLYHTHLDFHEGKLSFARSKEVSNCNLYRLGKKLGIPQLIVSNKFDAHDSWLPPCYVPTCDFKAPNTDDAEEKDKEMERLLSGQTIEKKAKENHTGWDEGSENLKSTADGIETITFPKQTRQMNDDISPLPYNLLTQQNISDKSIADAVEALIGVHLLTLGPNPTLKVMGWMGLTVVQDDTKIVANPPLLRFIDTPMNPNASINALNNLWQQFQFSALEEKIGYRFKDRAYLVQAFTHASYINNRVTGCYQRLEFLGDAVLDYMITRYLFEDVRQYSPGVLTDLRSALVNNTIFASLAVKYEFQKHFIALCPGLHHMIEKFVQLCADRSFETNFNTEMYMVTTEEEIDEGHEEDIEVPKAMGDIFESVAGAIYLDSGRNLDTTWQVIFHMMRGTIESCCANPPRSPVRELMELEASKARFSKMERILETGKVRVTVDVGNNMRFTGMGRSYRIAKNTAAKRALRYLHQMEEQRRVALVKEKAATAASQA